MNTEDFNFLFQLYAQTIQHNMAFNDAQNHMKFSYKKFGCSEAIIYYIYNKSSFFLLKK